MKGLQSALYFGHVTHRRYQPVHHELRYSVANLMVDVDQLPALGRAHWLFGYNRFSLFSIRDDQHGPGDGTPIARHIRALMDGLETTAKVERIFLFCYPAVLGHVFNPISVYFGLDAEGRVVAVVHEVNNTFGERHAYAIATEGDAAHRADKQFYVSPFNTVSGEYRFSIDFNDDHFRFNIALFDGAVLKLCARFVGTRRELSDGQLARSMISLLWQPIKVLGGIHWQALKLYMKGLRITPRPAHGKYVATLNGRRP